MTDSLARGGGHPIAAELVDALGSLERPDLLNVARAREIMGADGLPVQEAELRYGSRVALELVTIPLPGGRVVDARIYRPPGSDAGANNADEPAILLLHGGGFVGGEAASEHARALKYSAEACAVVVVPEYALAPEFIYPGGLDDCVETLRWMRDNARGLGLDVDRLIVAGVSAGAALATGTALRSRDEDGPTIRALMLLFPALDDRLETLSMRRFESAPVWDAVNSAHMWRLYLGEGEADGYAAPARAHRVGGLPQTFFTIAGIDPLRDEALEFAQRLLDAGVQVDIRLWGSAYHVFDQLVPDASLSMRSLDDQVAFICDATATPQNQSDD